MKRRMRNIHPGEILKSEVLDASDLTVTDGAKMLKVTHPTLSNIVNGKADLSTEMCYMIAAVFGGTPDVWANLQTKYNLRAFANKVKNLRLTPYHPHTSA